MMTWDQDDNCYMEKYISANGLEIYYKETGHGKPLILLHGATVTHKILEPHLEGFSRQYRVIAPDLRGHGRTLNPSRELSYQLMADDLVAFIQALDLNKPYLFGFSDGGQAVLDFALHYPDLPGALVVAGVWYQFSEEYQNNISRAGFVSPGVIDWEVYQQQAPSDWEERYRSSHPDPDPNYPSILLESLARLWWTPLNYTDDDFRKITVRTLIIMGELDEMIPLKEAREMAGLIPGAELVIIPGAGHNDVLKMGSKYISEFFRRAAS